MSLELYNYLLNPADFEFVKTIGQGQFSEVKLVKMKKHPYEQLALKAMPQELQDLESSKIFIRELLVLVLMKHPAILKFYGFSIPCSSNKNTFCTYTEYISGGTLKEITTDKEKAKLFDNTKKYICAYGIASAMSEVHRNKIIHRDLKPENIFLDEKLHPKVADFGLSRMISSGDTNLTTNLGTPYFMAPELFNEGGDDDIKVSFPIDVYAYAIVLLSLFDNSYKFTTKPPRSISELVQYILSGKRYAIPESMPKPYQKLIKKCWVGHPKERPEFKDICQELKSDKFLNEINEGKKINKDEIEEYFNLIDQFNEELHKSLSKLKADDDKNSDDDDVTADDEEGEDGAQAANNDDDDDYDGNETKPFNFLS